MSERLNLTDKASLLEKVAESAERKFMIAKGCWRWEAASLGEDELSFDFISIFPKACIHISFSLIDPNGVPCSALVQPTLFRESRASRSAKIPPNVISFLHRHVSNFCLSINQTRLNSPKSIGSFLQLLELRLRRSERTAVELAALVRRYHGILQLSVDSSTVQLEFEIASRDGIPKLRAIFDITDNYPFAPLRTCLDTFGEQVDVEHLRKLLIKNAKPGFGYLSRACSLIEAFVK